MNQGEKVKNLGYMGAILGDIVGSRFEFHNRKSKEFTMFHRKSVFTDDTVLTLAIMDVLNSGNLDEENIIRTLQNWAKSYPAAGYGARFKQWIYERDPEPYNSFGNGAAMRISPVAWYAQSEEELEDLVLRFTTITHNHIEGIRGAMVTAKAVYMAKNGSSKEEIKEMIQKNYNIDFNYDELVRDYLFTESCQETVPQALYCFLISNSLEDCLRTAVSIGGDSDTIAAIACSVGAAYYDDGYVILDESREFLEELKEVTEKFEQTLLNKLGE